MGCRGVYSLHTVSCQLREEAKRQLTKSRKQCKRSNGRWSESHFMHDLVHYEISYTVVRAPY